MTSPIEDKAAVPVAADLTTANETVVRNLELSESLRHTMECQLRLEMAKLEAEAIASKRAAEKAIRDAVTALDEVNNNSNSSNKSSHQQHEHTRGSSSSSWKANNNCNTKSIHGTTIDAIAQMIATAKKEAASGHDEIAAEEAREDTKTESEDNNNNTTTSSMDHESDDLRQPADREASSDTTTAVAPRKAPVVVSPPTTVRATEPPPVTNDSSEPVEPMPTTTMSQPMVVEPKLTNEKAAANEKSKSVIGDNNNVASEVVTSKTSNELVIQTNLSTTSTFDDPSTPTHKKDHSGTMEGTLAVVNAKIEEYSAILSDPASGIEEQVAAAELIRRYAKTAKTVRTVTRM